MPPRPSACFWASVSYLEYEAVCRPTGKPLFSAEMGETGTETDAFYLEERWVGDNVPIPCSGSLLDAWIWKNKPSSILISCACYDAEDC